MEFAPDELRDLAVFCARRFPGAAERARLTSAAGLGALVEAEDDEPTAPRRPGAPPALAAWAELLGHAQAQGRLEALVAAMVAAAPGDRNLAEAAALITGRAPPPEVTGAAPGARARRGLLLGLGIVAVLGVVVGWVLVGRGQDPAAPGATAASRPAAPVAAGAAPPPRAAGSPPTAAPVGVPTAAPPVNPAPPANPAPPVNPAPPAPPAAAAPTPPAPATAAAPPPRSTAATASPGSSPPGCEGAAGAVAGWWYAGAASPGAQGATITLDRSARVRADYPRRDNGYLATARERCVLPAGARVTLSHAPVHVEGDRWWVPFASGDLQR